MSNLIVKEFSFGDKGKLRMFKGVETLAKAVTSTLGAGGESVIFENAGGHPVITKDGVTVAEITIVEDPVENMGVSLIKEAARKTVAEAGDGTTTATLLAYAILKEAYKIKEKVSSRELKESINSAASVVFKFLEDTAKAVKGSMIDEVATISTNNDAELGKLIADAFRSVDLTGVVMMETSQSGETEIELSEGVQYEKGFTNAHFVNNVQNNSAELDNPVVLLVESQVDTIRQIQSILEHVIKSNLPLLIIGDLDPKVISTLAMNNNKNNLKACVIPAPTHGVNRKEMFDDLALLTGATVINENLGDDLDLIGVEHLGRCLKSTSTLQSTTIQVSDELIPEVTSIIEHIKEELVKESNPNKVIKLETRLAMLSAKIAIVKVGGNSDMELNEKRDRVEDAICATKAAIKEGVVAGGGVSLVNASELIKGKRHGELILKEAIKYPYNEILNNAGIEIKYFKKDGKGIDAKTGKEVDMLNAGIIDPLLVTKSALKNAISVASTMLSTNCIMSNMRQ
jgi:chaperonin GroEL